MAKIITVKIEGLSQLQRKLEELLPKQARAALKDGLTEGAKVMHTAIADETPTGKFGWLRGTVTENFSSREQGKIGIMRIGPSKEMHDPDPSEQHPKPASVIGSFVEFGTRHQAANPFMTRAFETAKEAALAKIVEKLKDALK